MWPKLRLATAFLRTRRLQRRLKTRADITAWQDRRIAKWRRDVLARTPFYQGLAGGQLDDMPVIDKAMLMGRFADFNRAGITAEQGWAAFAGDGRVGEHIVGASTGTSGNRGLFVISEAERWEWVGVILAKTMPRLRRAKVALVLPLNTKLYDAAGASRLMQLRFFDLNLGMAAWRQELESFEPDTLIAPPKVLRALVESGTELTPAHVFSAAEVLDPMDRKLVEARFGVTLREIYMATEGLLGVACEHGTLHLCEDAVKFEWEAVPGSVLQVPVITDFTRSTQAMARYRMNDLLTLSERVCACGSPLQVVERIEGRSDDIVQLGEVMITPDVLRNAIVDADRRITDFRVVQTGMATLEVSMLDFLHEDAARAALLAVRNVVSRLGADAEVSLHSVAAFPVSAKKLRRVERAWTP